nr:MAG TPA: hypothetical protein [Caudoviricetes sp.]
MKPGIQIEKYGVQLSNSTSKIIKILTEQH